MITVKDSVFRIDTAETTYLFRKTKYGHLGHLYYGPLLPADESADTIAQKRTVMVGASVLYEESDDLYCLDNLCLEWSDNGRGDYRQSPTEIKMPDTSFVSDFGFESYSVTDGNIPMEHMPSSYGGNETLMIVLKDTSCDCALHLYFSVYAQSDVITRRAVLVNNSEKPLTIRRMMSMMVDLPDENFRMVTLDGNWIKEAHLHSRPVQYGMIVNASTTGDSSNRHNPGFMLAESDANEDYGHVYGFNLIYSGNHYGAVEKSDNDFVRISLGINPHCFEWQLGQGEQFETPEAVMTFSDRGFNGMSHHFHDFVNHHIVRGDWKNRERPVLLNCWEAYFYDYNESKLLHLAKDAKQLGVELFVLDDGWFGNRNSDMAGLGDYTVNTKKFPHGLKSFADKIHSQGLDFGLWFEPEMVNPDSDLFRAHPEYAVTLPSKKPLMGRHQLMLDLCKSEVRDYIVQSVGDLLDEARIDYVKWDYNRHIAEGFSPSLQNQGEFYHRYCLGLYEILERIFRPRSHILFESCSSGGNRFDLGMLCYSPQIWTSDDTDPIERLKIQGGLSTLYPLSTMGAHVSAAPHQQTLRETPLATRFNVACFGCLGYEMDLKYLTPEEKKDVAGQIAFYKENRRLFQFGRFSRLKSRKPNKVIWQCVNEEKGKAVSGFFQTLAEAAESGDKLIVTGLADGFYNLHTRPQRLYIERFGGLIKHILPVELNPDGLILQTANRHYSLTDCVENYECSGAALRFGIPLNNQFIGTGYNANVRMLGDFGSNLYITQKIVKEEVNHEYQLET